MFNIRAEIILHGFRNRAGVYHKFKLKLLLPELLL
jgi:hypothetical protein